MSVASTNEIPVGSTKCQFLVIASVKNEKK